MRLNLKLFERTPVDFYTTCIVLVGTYFSGFLVGIEDVLNAIISAGIALIWYFIAKGRK